VADDEQDIESRLPEPPPAGGLALVAMRVADPKVSGRWYRGALGCVPLMAVERADGVVQENSVVMVQPSAGVVFVFHPRGDEPPDETMTQIGLGVDEPELVDAWAEHFDKLGLNHSGVLETELGRMLALPDPDGVVVSILGTTRRGGEVPPDA
jgi:catechol 2,3-dioxygenase-like lactoylglutathione lyase family enzyme